MGHVLRGFTRVSGTPTIDRSDHANARDDAGNVGQSSGWITDLKLKNE